VRPNNEDHYLVARFDRTFRPLLSNVPAENWPSPAAETAYALVVADGLGGCAAGEVASRTAIEALLELVLDTPDWYMRLDEEGFREVMRRMERRTQRLADFLAEKARGDAGLAGMGTTMTAACSLGADLLVTHVGDSRAYLFRGGELRRLTRDQTVAQEMADRGELSQEEVATHRLRHVLTSAVTAVGGPSRIDLYPERLADGDVLLLCSDGLTEMVSDEAVADVLRQGGPMTGACRALLDMALAAGGRDNVTVVLGRYRLPAKAAG
jgi:protein phosphatase